MTTLQEAKELQALAADLGLILTWEPTGDPLWFDYALSGPKGVLLETNDERNIECFLLGYDAGRGVRDV